MFSGIKVGKRGLACLRSVICVQVPSRRTTTSAQKIEKDEARPDGRHFCASAPQKATESAAPDRSGTRSTDDVHCSPCPQGYRPSGTTLPLAWRRLLTKA